MRYRRPLLLAALAACAAPLAQAAVFSIDYGTDWFKFALVQGAKLDIVLNIDSQRKTASTVVIQNVTRSFANDAVNLGTRYPSQSYPALKHLLGRAFRDGHCETYRRTFQNTMREDPERGTAVFSHIVNGEEVELSAEELVGMQFAYARRIVEAAASGPVKDVVITVPPYFTQFERQAVLDAAEIAGLRVLQLIHDNTAVALNYALANSFTEKPAHHIFYDSGAGSTVASLISFATVPSSRSSRFNSTVVVEVRALGYDRTLGGHEIDVRLQKWLAEEFMRQHKAKLKGDVFKDQRAMMRLLKEANRVKQILSANVDTHSSIESLMEEVDFRTSITRATLESICSDLIDRVTGPLDVVLKKAGLEKTDVESLVLVGGNVRVPAIQRQLQEYMGSEKIAKNVNGDEAAAMGAAFRAAFLSSQFSIPMEMVIKEMNSYPIVIEYPVGVDEKAVSTILFNDKATFSSKKMMTFKKKADFSFTASYNVTENAEAFGPKEILAVEVGGVAEALEMYKDATVEEPKVKVTMKLTTSGMFEVEKGVAEMVMPQTEDKSRSLKQKVMSYFGGGSEKNDTEVLGGNTTISNSTNATAAAQEPERVTKAVPLKLTTEPKGIPPLTKKQKESAISRNNHMDHVDRETKLREEARNNLESFVYRVQDWMLTKPIKVVSTEQQQEVLKKKLHEASDWLYEEGERAVKDEITKWLDELKSLHGQIAFRLAEHADRPEAVSGLRATLSKARQMVSLHRTPASAPTQGNENVDFGEALRPKLDSLLKLADEAERWLEESELAQLARLPVEEAAFTSADVLKKAEEVEASSARVQALVKAEEDRLRKKAEKEAKELRKKLEKEAEEAKAKAEAAEAGTGATDGVPPEQAETTPPPEEEDSAAEKAERKHEEL